ncbi:MAG: hypothetical protein ACRC62_39765, partial [Microcoleus sp.]
EFGMQPNCGCWVSLRSTQPTYVGVGFLCVQPNLRMLMLGFSAFNPTYVCWCWVSLRSTQPTYVDVGFPCVQPNLQQLPTTNYQLSTIT